MSSPWRDPTGARAPGRGRSERRSRPRSGFSPASNPSQPAEVRRTPRSRLLDERRARESARSRIRARSLERGPASRCLEDECTLLQGNRQVLTRAGPSHQLIAPTGEGVDPGPDREVIEALVGDRDGPVPAVVVRRRHRQRGPAGGRLVAVAESHTRADRARRRTHRPRRTVVRPPSSWPAAGPRPPAVGRRARQVAPTPGEAGAPGGLRWVRPSAGTAADPDV